MIQPQWGILLFVIVVILLACSYYSNKIVSLQKENEQLLRRLKRESDRNDWIEAELAERGEPTDWIFKPFEDRDA